MKEKTYVVIPFMAGTDDDTAIVFINATFQIKDDLVKRYPHPEFGPWLIEQIYDVQKILAEKKGLFKKKYICPSCATELNPDSRRPIESNYELAFLDFAPFTVKITIPAVECPQCKKICGIDLKDSLGCHLNDAIIHAFDSQNIKP
jgi:hypothetical protein